MAKTESRTGKIPFSEYFEFRYEAEVSALPIEPLGNIERRFTDTERYLIDPEGNQIRVQIMRMLRKNQSLLKYSNQAAIVPAFETDENGNIKFWSYIDDDGNEFFYEDTDGNKIPMFADSGTETLYGEPINFMASIAMSGGEAESVEYGLSITEYEAVAIVQRGTVPLTEGSLIWFQSKRRTDSHIGK